MKVNVGYVLRQDSALEQATIYAVEALL